MKASWTRSEPPRVHEIARVTGFTSKETIEVVRALGFPAKSASSRVPLSVALDTTHYLSRVRHGDFGPMVAL